MLLISLFALGLGIAILWLWSLFAAKNSPHMPSDKEVEELERHLMRKALNRGHELHE